MTSYAYLARSGFSSSADLLELQTSGGSQAHPQFFTGFVTTPAATAAGLLAVAGAALTRFDGRDFDRIYRDPVVTAGEGRLRFEAFSVCNGVYARMDLLPAGLDGEVLSHGTTNVDVSPSLRTALTRVRGDDPMHVAVGPDELAVTTFDGRLVERKVPLPARWLRGFAEAQAISAGFDLRAELDRAGAVAFFNQLPRGSGRDRRNTVWAVPARRSLRLAARPIPGAICLGGTSRLEVLRPFLRHATGLRVYGPTVTAGSVPVASSWELATPALRLSVTLSPEAVRGFSGEGAALEQLSSDQAVADADLISALLAWDTAIDVYALPAASGLAPGRVRAALAVLATAGRVGYDAAEARYFHRAMPYLAAVDQLNPRLRRAKALLAAGEVRVSGETAIVADRHHVRITDDVITCTCTWWREHRGGRGPCAHALAFRMALGAGGSASSSSSASPSSVSAARAAGSQVTR